MFLSAQNTTQKNVLFIVVDDLSAQPGAMPAVQTPHLDRLKQKGLTFSQAYAPVPLCNPSRTAILTGVAPWQTGIYSNAANFRETSGFENAVTLPQFFKNQGYQSFSSGKIFHHSLGRRSDSLSWTLNATQIDVIYGSKENQATPLPGTGRSTSVYVEQVPLAWGQLDKSIEEMDDWKNVQQAVRFLNEQVPGDSAFFLACGIVRPHLPHFYPKEYAGMYPDLELPAFLEPGTGKPDTWDCPHQGNSILDSILAQPDGPQQWRQMVQSYLRCIAFADYCVGLLLDAYERLPEEVKKNTLIVLLGDHGFHLGQKSGWAKVSPPEAPMVWEQTTHTPLLIADPQQPQSKGGQCLQPVSLQDLYPTILELCGFSPEQFPDNDPFSKKKIWGRSLAPLIREPLGNGHPAYALSVMEAGVISLRTPDWRYIDYPDKEKAELYYHGPRTETLNPDPEEFYNLLHPGRVTPGSLQAAKKLRKISIQIKKGKLQ